MTETAARAREPVRRLRERVSIATAPRPVTEDDVRRICVAAY
jgi:hypothetical protein